MVSLVPFFVMIVTTNAITWSDELSPKPSEFANKTGCYIKEVNDVIPFNDSVSVVGFCYLIHCTTKQIDYVSCGVRKNDNERCVVTQGELNAPYPECCPYVKCYKSDIPWLYKNITVVTTNIPIA